MMPQSSALKRLELILDEALTNGNRSQASGPILLKVMNLSNDPQHLIDFYEILYKAEEEARSLINIPKIDKCLKVMEDLQRCFSEYSTWQTQWKTFATHIEQKNVIPTLHLLAYSYDQKPPTVLLEKEFLEKLNSEFESLRDKVLKSDISKEFKTFLIERIEDILKAIRIYHIDGTEGLQKAAKSLVSDLVMTEHSLKVEDKKSPMYKQVKTWVFSLLLYIAPSPYDIIGAVPAIEGYWKPKFEEIEGYWNPKFEELVAVQEKLEEVVCEASTIQEAFEKASKEFSREAQKRLSGKEQKALPPSKDNSETSFEDKNAP